MIGAKKTNVYLQDILLKRPSLHIRCGAVVELCLFYEYEHIPGIDFLGRNITSDISPKQVGSVSAQLGKKKVLSEMFGCCGWDVTPYELKKDC